MHEQTIMLLTFGGIFLFVIILIGCWVYRKNNNNEKMQLPQPPRQRQAPKAQVAPPAQNKPKGAIVLFYGVNCPHCHSMMPEWQRAKAELQKFVQAIEIETSSNPMAQQANLRGVPTIRKYPNGVEDFNNFIEYSGNRTADSIVDFAKQI